jgi:HPt (histidine-containing phosphotransfer) domain-containing protein
MTLLSSDSLTSDRSPAFNRDDFIRRLGGDEETAADILELFLSDLESQLLEIKLSVDAESVSELRLKTHALKGASANVGAQAVRDAAMALEKAEGGKSRLTALFVELAARCGEFGMDSDVKELLKRKGGAL